MAEWEAVSVRGGRVSVVGGVCVGGSIGGGTGGGVEGGGGGGVEREWGAQGLGGGGDGGRRSCSER